MKSMHFWLFTVFACLVGTTLGNDENHLYNDKEEVTIWTNKVGPYHNPQETYSYYSLPFCRPQQEKKTRKSPDGLGSILEGNELSDSGFLLRFKENQQRTKMCDMKIDESGAEKLTLAVSQHYWYQMYIDDLPVWGMVGELMTAERGDKTGTTKVQQGFVYTHKDFSIAYNGDQIIQVNLTSEDPRPIIAGESHPMTFSVRWVPTNLEFVHRFDRYLDFDFFEHQIHWFSIFNSFMMVVFLCGLVALILTRTLKNDYARYTSEEEDPDTEMNANLEETGWKQVHGDVFRPPAFPLLYSAFIGIGSQLLCIILSIICMAIFANMIADIHGERGVVTTFIVVLYCLTAPIAGYVSGSYYKRCGEKDWKECMLATATLFPMTCFSIAFMLNCVAVYYDSLIAIPFSAMVSVVAIFLLVSCPLVLVGTLMGRSNTQELDFPCRVNQFKRPIPDVPWYVTPGVMSCFGGILPFGSIFIEMYFVFTSFWNYKFYYVYGFMLLVFVILMIVTVCVTIVSTYFLLNAEDYRWQWTAFGAGGSTAVYVFLYAVYYFFTKTHMSGFLQTSFYFGYMSMFSVAMFVMCGTIGYLGTNIFVTRIYHYIHID
eukprot:TRINITY_DN7529_c0_g1_i1.p1 TRINITY_DN7529_c0_g1~~TRINITY_DN7529_c0_g1_i1.p1  ORF type:complete len:599 (-),score=94.51 TRINITY_DN7529_c0_g1_i1:130-1926(-)